MKRKLLFTVFVPTFVIDTHFYDDFTLSRREGEPLFRWFVRNGYVSSPMWVHGSLMQQAVQVAYEAYIGRLIVE